MATIWRNRIEAGTKKLNSCPAKYRNDVIVLIQADLSSGAYTEAQLRSLVSKELMTEEEFNEIVG